MASSLEEEGEVVGYRDGGGALVDQSVAMLMLQTRAQPKSTVREKA